MLCRSRAIAPYQNCIIRATISIRAVFFFVFCFFLHFRLYAFRTKFIAYVAFRKQQQWNEGKKTLNDWKWKRNYATSGCVSVCLPPIVWMGYAAITGNASRYTSSHNVQVARLHEHIRNPRHNTFERCTCWNRNDFLRHLGPFMYREPQQNNMSNRISKYFNSNRLGAEFSYLRWTSDAIETSMTAINRV